MKQNAVQHFVASVFAMKDAETESRIWLALMAGKTVSPADKLVEQTLRTTADSLHQSIAVLVATPVVVDP
jgi:hypothetical protein